MNLIPELPVGTLQHVHGTRIVRIPGSSSFFGHTDVPRRVTSPVSDWRLVVVGLGAGVWSKEVSRMFYGNSICWCVAKLVCWT